MTSAAAPHLPRKRRQGVLTALNHFVRGRSDIFDTASTATRVQRRPSFDISFTGLVYLAMMMFLGVAGVNTQANLLFALFGMMIGIMLVSHFLCRWGLARLNATRVLPDHATVGQTSTIRYRFTNSKRFWPSLSVNLAELDGNEAFSRQVHAYMLHAAARMTAEVPIEVVAKRRGIHKLSKFQLSTSFPFGFIHRALGRRQDDSILVYPAVAEVSPKLLALCRSAERGGANMQPRANGSDEFYGVKEFRPGNNPRWIHWKRSARTGTLISKEMAQISPPQLLIILDTFVTGAPGESAAIERSVASAASLAREALANSMAVGLVVWNNGWVAISPQRGKRHWQDVLAAIAAAPINRAGNSDQLIGSVMKLLRQAMTPVLFTPRILQNSRSEQTRGGILTVWSESAQARAWFKFDPSIDFSNCGPVDHATGK